ncbi:ArsR/SmtB family transcription factor [Amycolatopsis sp. WGS_07]|uniref:ArsR/SmtB family transcription factor n=1 Tax=Amycolatopsis sp. WGS_07 TaxID=3076764 RepID=UPI0038730C6E
MLRVHFTAEDLLDVTFAEEPAPLMELGLALATLQRDDGLEPALHRWRRGLRCELPGAARALLEIVPPAANGPLFLDPPVADLEHGLERVMTTPRGFVESELHKVLDSRARPSSWTRGLMAREGAAWKGLHASLRSAYGSVLSRSWPGLRNGFHLERAWRVHQLSRAGLRGTLAAWEPDLRWRGTVLEVRHPRDFDIVPAGRGIRLLPSMCWTGRPLIANQPAGPTLLVYPALASLPQLAAAPADDPLVALLGFTRAYVLSVLTRPRNTSEIAAEVGISKSSASQHAAVLRRAGLVTSRRDGKAVWHSCTSAGLDLLAGQWRS